MLFKHHAGVACDYSLTDFTPALRLLCDLFGYLVIPQVFFSKLLLLRLFLAGRKKRLKGEGIGLSGTGAGRDQN